MNVKKAMTKVVAPRYQKAGKKERGRILDEFVQTTGYHRCYASQLLRTQGQKVRLSRTLVLVKDVTQSRPRQPSRIYDQSVKRALEQLWLIMDGICGKRLVVMLPKIIPILEQHDEIHLDGETREKLLHISAATIDRVLSAEKKKWALKSRSRTKPGTLLKQQIPIRTFAQWDEQRPGFVKIDLVAHEGGDAHGDFLHTLDVTDVCTGWTETQGVRNKAQKHVFEALRAIQARLPFKLLGIDSDNGSEFINSHLMRFCRKEEITFTRARPYRRNDNCYVEQKNYSVVRRAVGYARYDTSEQLGVLNQLYASLRLYINFFQPSMKLKEKIRVGARVKKTYDRPQTPYERVLQSPSVPEEHKPRLSHHYAQLNPAALKREITRCQQQLLKLARRPEPASRTKQDHNAPRQHDNAPRQERWKRPAGQRVKRTGKIRRGTERLEKCKGRRLY
jgi:hypothetical protein